MSHVKVNLIVRSTTRFYVHITSFIIFLLDMFKYSEWFMCTLTHRFTVNTKRCSVIKTVHREYSHFRFTMIIHICVSVSLLKIKQALHKTKPAAFFVMKIISLIDLKI